MTADGAVAQLRDAVQALAQPALVQRSLFPSFAAAGDELAIDFEIAIAACAEAGVHHAAPRGEAIADLDAYLLSLSGPSHLAFWDDLDDPRWARARVLASAVLVEYGWPEVAPVRNDVVVLVNGSQHRR